MQLLGGNAHRRMPLKVSIEACCLEEGALLSRLVAASLGKWLYWGATVGGGLGKKKRAPGCIQEGTADIY